MSSEFSELSQRDKKDALECIREFIQDKRDIVKLSPTVETIYSRLRAAWAYMAKDFKSREQTITMLQKEFGISEAQAKRDIQDCMCLYGDVYRTDKEATRAIAAEMAMKIFRLGKKNNDLGAMEGALKSFIKLNGIDKEDVDKPDFKKLQASVNVYVMDDASRQLTQRLLQKPGTLDLNNITYAEYTEVADSAGADQSGD